MFTESKGNPKPVGGPASSVQHHEVCGEPVLAI